MTHKKGTAAARGRTEDARKRGGNEICAQRRIFYMTRVGDVGAVGGEKNQWSEVADGSGDSNTTIKDALGVWLSARLPIWKSVCLPATRIAFISTAVPPLSWPQDSFEALRYWSFTTTQGGAQHRQGSIVSDQSVARGDPLSSRRMEYCVWKRCCPSFNIKTSQGLVARDRIRENV
ncbi:hypothetical protein K469DRAFT_775157 [Zopfia rhizophila CBS 207.26]|uniref:Uncharacterized protein n=1 Tax=Zopfia rhizophila CBS 207.26 TaxID=1314779 RepID=A0A6A6E5Q2_9PEZI|nr:hypothetical protein K469DRAFT_775157 [Zopfia rhizophila CBS 207.26]